MILKDFNNIWGIPLDEVRKQGRRYKTYQWIIYILDILMTVVCGIYMFKTGASFNICVFITILITLVVFMMLSVIINPEKWRAYLFYRKNKRQEVVEMTLFVKEDNMKSMLYCSNYKRKNLKGTISDFQEVMLSACREDSIFAKRLGNLLSKFTVNDDGMVEIKAYMLKKGRKYFLLSFDDEDVKESSEEE